MRGIDQRPVEPDQPTKSIGAEDTFPEDLSNIEQMNGQLEKIATVVHTRLTARGLKGRTITVKIKYSDFRTITRSRSLPEPTTDLLLIIATVKELLLSTQPNELRVRLLGISVSNFGGREQLKKIILGQLPLFD